MKKLLFLMFLAFCVQLYAQERGHKNRVDEKRAEQENIYFQKLIDSSNFYYFEGKYEKSLATNISILDKAFELENNHYIQQAYRMLGYDYIALDNINLSRENFGKAEQFAKLSKNDAATALIYMDLANLYSNETKNTNKAYSYLDKAILLFEKLDDKTGLAKAHYDSALAAFKANDYNKAYIHILKARKLNRFEANSDYWVGLEYLSGKYYSKKGNFDLAEKYFLNAISVAKKENLPGALEEAYVYYSESLYSQRKFKEAFETLRKFEEYKAGNKGSLKSSEVDALAVKFQLAEYRKDVKAAELENQLQAEILKNRNRINNILLFISASFLLMFLALVVAYRKRKSLVKELKIKNTEYLKAKERSEKLTKAKTKFFSTVSHELRTPLYGVIGLTSILLEDKTLVKHKKNLKSLKFSADYLLALINDVLQINKLDSNIIEDEQTVFSLKELIGKIVTSFEYSRTQHCNNIHVKIADTVPDQLRGNAVRLSQILMNLVSNACKFTENGNIFIIAENLEVKSTTALIRITIKDSGVGISRQNMEIIFDEFSQLDPENYKTQGTGLGLSIVKKLLSMSNAVLHVESEMGKGSAFSFSLLFDVVENKLPKSKPQPLQTKVLKKKKILVVEDNRINQIVTKKILESNHILCTIAENGEEAIKKINKDGFDLILMDINMPVKNGIDATREIRVFNQTLPIIALTAVDMEEMRQEIFDCGMNDIIVKPYDVSKFLQTILKNMPHETVRSTRKKTMNEI